MGGSGIISVEKILCFGKPGPSEIFTRDERYNKERSIQINGSAMGGSTGQHREEKQKLYKKMGIPMGVSTATLERGTAEAIQEDVNLRGAARRQ